eukprot:3611369-Rhodomonas_salina.1
MSTRTTRLASTRWRMSPTPCSTTFVSSSKLKLAPSPAQPLTTKRHTQTALLPVHAHVCCCREKKHAVCSLLASGVSKTHPPGLERTRCERKLLRGCSPGSVRSGLAK